ncbi:MAG: DUF3667 domain-containing protein [Alphaproteobacteria bacterium]|nr:DUF3667 domain-containing protein [Alphaproteobacteria bacterium]
MTAVPTAQSCANCGAPLTGRYCARCGQDSHEHRVPVRSLLTEAADQFFSVDSRILRTLYLLIAKPGALTHEYIAGRRQPYVPALRLYLFITVAFFVGLSAFNIAFLQLVPYDPKTEPPASYVAVSNDVAGMVAARYVLLRPLQHVTLTDAQRAALQKMRANLESQSVTSAAIGDRLVRIMMRAYADSAAFNAEIQVWVTRFLLLMMPLFALGVAALRPGRFLIIDHLIFALHLHSFLFVLLFAAVGLAALVPGPFVLLTVLLVAALYLFLSLRRAYGLNLLGAGWRALVLLVSYCFAFSSGLQALLLLTMGS